MSDETETKTDSEKLAEIDKVMRDSFQYSDGEVIGKISKILWGDKGFRGGLALVLLFLGTLIVFATPSTARADDPYGWGYSYPPGGCYWFEVGQSWQGFDDYGEWTVWECGDGYNWWLLASYPPVPPSSSYPPGECYMNEEGQVQPGWDGNGNIVDYVCVREQSWGTFGFTYIYVWRPVAEPQGDGDPGVAFCDLYCGGEGVDIPYWLL